LFSPESTLTPPLEDSRSEIDMDTTNRSFVQRNQDIEEEFKKQCRGSSSPSKQLVVTCVIRQPMDSVGVKAKYRSLHNQAFKFGIDLRDRESSLTKDGGGERGGSVGLIASRNAGLLNKSQNGQDLTKMNSINGERSAGRNRGNSVEVRSNRSAG